MAIATNTYLSFSSKRNREEFSNAIYQITPEDTPFISMIGKGSCDSVHPEWSTDALASPNPANAVVEGDEYTYGAITATARVGNYTQISRKEWIISGTQEKVDKAGGSEVGRARAKKGAELRKDMEAIVLSNQASLAGNSTTARLLGGLPSWIVTNDSRGATGADGGFSAGTGLTVAATNGTQRALTKPLLDSVLQLAYSAGSDVRAVMTSPYAKTVFSTFMSDANVAPQRMSTSSSKQATIVGAADTYLYDFGTVDIIPNRVMTTTALARNAFVIDPDYASLLTLRDIFEDKPAKTGDAEKRVLLVEYTLKVNNEAGHGVVADIFGMSAST